MPTINPKSKTLLKNKGFKDGDLVTEIIGQLA
jgi:hypothetical protein